MNIVFLDVDGVLNNDLTKERTSDWSGTEYTGIEDCLVEKLSRIVKTCNAQIVLVSSWKKCWDDMGPHDELHPMAKYLLLKLQKYDLHIADRTTDRGKGDRGYGIKRWLKRFPEVERWVVIDDKVFSDYEVEGIPRHLIHVSHITGITDEDVDKAIEFFTKPIKSREKK